MVTHEAIRPTIDYVKFESHLLKKQFHNSGIAKNIKWSCCKNQFNGDQSVIDDVTKHSINILDIWL